MMNFHLGIEIVNSSGYCLLGFIAYCHHINVTLLVSMISLSQYAVTSKEPRSQDRVLMSTFHDGLRHKIFMY
jgi:hypothetical protein